MGRDAAAGIYAQALELFQRITREGLKNENFVVQGKLIELCRDLMTISGGHYSSKLADMISNAYPDDFIIADCATCGGKNFKSAYTGHKPLPTILYPGAQAFPFYSRGIFPLIYGECLQCGSARINPSPARKYVDFPLPDVCEAGGWKDEEAYIKDKQTSLRVHIERLKLQRFQLSQDSKVLDVSCGSGVGLELLRDEFKWKTGVGVETDPQAVHLARGRSLDVSLGFIYDAPLEKGFDLAIMDNALEHHWDPKDVLARLHTLLNKGAGLFIIVPNYHGYSVELFGVEYCNMNWGHWHFFTVQALANLLKKTGFRIDRAYSGYCAQTVIDRLGKIPDGIDFEASGEAIDKIDLKDKAFRGDFIQILAVAD